MSKKAKDQEPPIIINVEIDPTECPFREFRDSELSQDYWGMGPATLRAAILTKVVPKLPPDYIWNDDQTQPLPRSVRHYLHGWIRAEDLAFTRWEAEAVIFEENNSGKMSVMDMQLSHAQVMLRSSFSRRVLSACFMLERVDGLVAEHQWENFSFSMPEGWRARYHIYSPGMKSGGGLQHRPGLSKTGCYLVRLYYLGAWRCVWVSDQVPVDANDSPLLPFSPLLSQAPARPGVKVPTMVTSSVVHLWPLLICKALLKLAAPDMNSDEDTDSITDEVMPDFNIMHALTGFMEMNFGQPDIEKLWDLIISEVPAFAWDDDDDTLASTVKSRSTKKPTTKETAIVKRGSMAVVILKDSKEIPPYALPGITPGHEMSLMVTMARDVPIKKPLPEPEVALWKYYRWVDWARRHGLYEAYDCPRTRFLKVNGLLKLSYAPHLLDVQSTESITAGFRDEHDKGTQKKGGKDQTRSATGLNAAAQTQQKEELREWVPFDNVHELTKNLSILYYPSMFQFTSTASAPPMRITRVPLSRALDIVAPKSAPLYLQLDGPEENCLRLSLSMLHPRVMLDCGIPVLDFIEPAYLILERFEWFIDNEVPLAKAFVSTRGYDTVEVKFLPGRHFCRLWVHSRMNWHVALLSDSSLLLGTRDTIQAAASHECPWVARFLSNLSTSFANWIRISRSNTSILSVDREFYRSYQPDLTWDCELVGYDKHFLHWMFRQALQSLLMRRMSAADFYAASAVLRKYLCDPNFGMPDKPPVKKSLREIVAADPCDCVMPEVEEMEEIEEEQVQEAEQVDDGEEKPLVDAEIMDQLLKPPVYPVTSQVCELATEELPCGVLKEEREKVIKKHEAATVLQAYWRGTWVRKCLSGHAVLTPEIFKSLMENAFGNIECLSALMNEFFGMYPGAKYAYSIGSALGGVYGLQQHTGTSLVTPLCKWIPYFQGVFYCHAPVKAHFDVNSTLQFHNVAVYDNDTGSQLPQAYGAHITFDVVPNNHGYTVMGHGTLNNPAGIYFDVSWQLTVLTSVDNVFHICDSSDMDFCKEMPLQPATKLHIDEIFIPNRRDILGGIQLSVLKHEAVSFRAAATSPDLDMIAVLRSTSEGEVEEVDRCAGKGELYWPYIRLEPAPPPVLTSAKRRSCSQSHANIEGAALSARSLKMNKQTKPNSAGARSASKGKPASAKDKDKDKGKAEPVNSRLQPQPGDASVELECSLVVGGGTVAKRDDERDLEFALARRNWDANEPGIWRRD
ncbi:hypothetical protein MSG28_003855 [Choristoneura fumiferana]|uniref:Uncharacterized protein n=1 Tax=Choristoneura fumiferana TaxID=7141 RepID=A0ACC0KH26_CHOFU|nr:hypothetical protein MSG28_003855 [Choristoneura fumiferana]